MNFPEIHAARRTDESFRIKADEDHHLECSPLLETNISMVSCFPHDYMHLVCLGVVRRLLDLWMGSTGRHPITFLVPFQNPLKKFLTLALLYVLLSFLVNGYGFSGFFTNGYGLAGLNTKPLSI